MNNDFLGLVRDNKEDKVMCIINDVDEMNYLRALKFAIANENIRLCKFFIKKNVELNNSKTVKILELAIDNNDKELFEMILIRDKYNCYDKYMHLFIDNYDLFDLVIKYKKFKDPYYVAKMFSINTRLSVDQNIDLMKRMMGENFNKIVYKYFIQSDNENIKQVVELLMQTHDFDDHSKTRIDNYYRKVYTN
jgi:hypothetical protein